jgi:hypothetical protein
MAALGKHIRTLQQNHPYNMGVQHAARTPVQRKNIY